MFKIIKKPLYSIFISIVYTFGFIKGIISLKNPFQEGKKFVNGIFYLD